MTSFNDVNKRLRKKNRGRYALLASCCFVSVLLITAYISMMGSETVLSVLPEGGDSRKQMMMIFALAVIGCAVFTTYAAGIFFREKSRETGIFLALGATRKQLARALYGELTVIGLVSWGLVHFWGCLLRHSFGRGSASLSSIATRWPFPLTCKPSWWLGSLPSLCW